MQTPRLHPDCLFINLLSLVLPSLSGASVIISTPHTSLANSGSFATKQGSGSWLHRAVHSARDDCHSEPRHLWAMSLKTSYHLHYLNVEMFEGESLIAM